jgi:hypothetical protein
VKNLRPAITSSSLVSLSVLPLSSVRSAQSGCKHNRCVEVRISRTQADLLRIPPADASLQHILDDVDENPLLVLSDITVSNFSLHDPCCSETLRV